MKLSAGSSLSAIFISLSIITSGQTFEITLGGNMADAAHDAVFLENGEMIITGASYLQEGSGMDAFTAKLSSTGEIIWQTTFGYAFEDGGNEIAIGNDGNIFIAGHTDITGMDICDAYCFYLSAEGDTLWTRKFGYEADDAAYGCTIANDGGFIAVGRAMMEGDPVGFIIKYNETGDLMWMKNYGSGADDYFTDIIQSPDGGYFLCGRNSETDAGDFWLMKIDNNGDAIWSTTFATDLIDIAYSIAIADDGGLLLAGKSCDNATISKVFLVRTNALGEFIWQYIDGGHEHDMAHGVTATAEGNWVVTGTSYNMLTHSNDAMLMEMSDAGMMNWTKYYGSSNDDHGQRVRADQNGHFLLSGGINYTGNDDMLILKTDKWGDIASSVFNPHLHTSNINAYPNPCTDEVIFHMDQINSEMQFTIYDLTGQVVYELHSLHSEVLTVSTSLLLPGIYFYRLTDTGSNTAAVCGQLAVQ